MSPVQEEAVPDELLNLIHHLLPKEEEPWI